MGNPWHIYIQGRFRRKWVTMYTFDQKNCRPILRGIEEVATRYNVSGRYGMEYPTNIPILVDEHHVCDEYDRLYSEMKSLDEIYDENGHPKKIDAMLAVSQKRKYDDITCSNSSNALSPHEVLAKRAEKAALDNEYSQVGFMDMDNPASHCFIVSQQELATLVNTIPPVKDKDYLCYHAALACVHRWTEMLKTAFPRVYTEFNPWLNSRKECTDAITKDIKNILQKDAQEEKKVDIGNLNVVAAHYNLSVDLELQIGKFLLFAGAKDMRIAFYDSYYNCRAQISAV